MLGSTQSWYSITILGLRSATCGIVTPRVLPGAGVYQASGLKENLSTMTNQEIPLRRKIDFETEVLREGGDRKEAIFQN